MKMMHLSRDEIKNFKPSEEMIKAASLVFLCMANVETIKPLVEGIQRKVLEKYHFKIEQRWLEKKFKERDRVILKPSEAYLMSDTDFKVYHLECREMEDAIGLKVSNPEFCPLLVAEDDLRKAENLLIDAYTPMTGIEHKDLYMLDHRERYLDITLKYMAQFVDSKKIIQELIF